jgi:hypothetical protein
MHGTPYPTSGDVTSAAAATVMGQSTQCHSGNHCHVTVVEGERSVDWSVTVAAAALPTVTLCWLAHYRSSGSACYVTTGRGGGAMHSANMSQYFTSSMHNTHKRIMSRNKIFVHDMDLVIVSPSLWWRIVPRPLSMQLIEECCTQVWAIWIQSTQISTHCFSKFSFNCVLHLFIYVPNVILIYLSGILCSLDWINGILQWMNEWMYKILVSILFMHFLFSHM